MTDKVIDGPLRGPAETRGVTDALDKDTQARETGYAAGHDDRRHARIDRI